MFGSRLATFAVLATFGIAAPCDAQFFRVGGFGGVNVRAPFVSVDVGPYGGTRVVAPFTSVYSYGPAFSYRRSVVGVPAFPPLPPFAVVPAFPAYSVPVFGVQTFGVQTFGVPAVPQVVYQEPSIPVEGYQVTRPSLDGHVAEDLRCAAIRFQYSLSQRHDGDVWLDYLGPGRIVAAIEQGDPPSSLRDLIQNYDGVVANASLSAIYRASGFNETRELLRVYVDLPQAGSQPAASTPAPPPAQPPATAIEETTDAIDRDQPEELPAPRGNDETKDKKPVPPPPDPMPPRKASLEPTDL